MWLALEKSDAFITAWFVCRERFASFLAMAAAHGIAISGGGALAKPVSASHLIPRPGRDLASEAI